MLLEIYINHDWHWELQHCIIMISNIVVIAWEKKKKKARYNTYTLLYTYSI